MKDAEHTQTIEMKFTSRRTCAIVRNVRLELRARGDGTVKWMANWADTFTFDLDSGQAAMEAALSAVTSSGLVRARGVVKPCRTAREREITGWVEYWDVDVPVLKRRPV